MLKKYLSRRTVFARLPGFSGQIAPDILLAPISGQAKNARIFNAKFKNTSNLEKKNCGKLSRLHLGLKMVRFFS